MRTVSNRRLRPRRRLSESQLAIEVERRAARCPLSAGEITEWARQLGRGGADGERRLKNLVTYWFDQASSFSRESEATDAALVRDHVKRRLSQGDSPDTIAVPPNSHRIDKWLPELSNQLTRIRGELLDLPGSVDAALRVRFGNYGKALDHLAALAVMLNSIGEAWHRPHSGHPSLETESYAVQLLIRAVEDFLEEEFPSPRSYKRAAEIEFAHLLAGRLFPKATGPQIRTMFRHYHKRRLDKGRGGRASAQRDQL